MSSWIIWHYLTDYHMQEAGMSLRKMSQYNRGSICYSHARKAVRTQCAANCTNTGVEKGIQREHQNHCHPQVTTGCITALLPSANLYCVPGTQATPQQLEEWIPEGRSRVPIYPFPIICTSQKWQNSLTWVGPEQWLSALLKNSETQPMHISFLRACRSANPGLQVWVILNLRSTTVQNILCENSQSL